MIGVKIGTRRTPQASVPDRMCGRKTAGTEQFRAGRFVR
jgi:hypothetical protein